MAKSKVRSSFGLTREAFFRFTGRIGALAQKLADANMAHAGEWNKAEALGIHVAAAKLFVRLDKMDGLKRADFLRSFDLMRSWADWGDQLDIVDAVEQASGEEEPLDEIDAGEEGGEETEHADHETMIREPADPAPQVKAEGDDPEAAAQETAELAMAGHVFADGKRAALDGLGADANPHPQDAPSHPIWLRGHAQGLRDKEAAEAPIADVVSMPKRGRRGAEAERIQEVETVH